MFEPTQNIPLTKNERAKPGLLHTSLIESRGQDLSYATPAAAAAIAAAAAAATDSCSYRCSPCLPCPRSLPTSAASATATICPTTRSNAYWNASCCM